MRAAVYTRYGAPDVLELRERPRPVPADDEVFGDIFERWGGFAEYVCAPQREPGAA